MRAKKSLGQHFLTNPQIAARIVDALESATAIDHIVEVGPGRGILTQRLTARAEKLLLIEKDQALAAQLQSEYASARCQVVEADFLKCRLPELISGPFHLIGNFPYNISSQIVIKMLDNKTNIPQMVGMFQKEVALRLASSHGSKQYGVLSVFLQTFYEVEVLFQLEPGAFSPPPKVKSAVIRCRRHNQTSMSLEEEKHFRKVVKMAFGQRRKMLRNSLSGLLPQANEQVAPYLTLRPEQLSKEDFVQLASLLSQG